jgi:hypothetical protein
MLITDSGVSTTYYDDARPTIWMAWLAVAWMMVRERGDKYKGKP